MGRTVRPSEGPALRSHFEAPHGLQHRQRGEQGVGTAGSLSRERLGPHQCRHHPHPLCAGLCRERPKSVHLITIIGGCNWGTAPLTPTKAALSRGAGQPCDRPLTQTSPDAGLAATVPGQQGSSGGPGGPHSRLGGDCERTWVLHTCSPTAALTCRLWDPRPALQFFSSEHDASPGGCPRRPLEYLTLASRRGLCDGGERTRTGTPGGSSAPRGAVSSVSSRGPGPGCPRSGGVRPSRDTTGLPSLHAGDQHTPQK